MQSFSQGFTGNGHDLTSDGGTYTYVYDDENRLTSIIGANTTSFEYDPLGRLYEATVNGVVTQFLYDGDALVAEYDDTGNIIKRYVHGDRVDEPWVQYSGSSTLLANSQFLHANHQCSIIAHSDLDANVSATQAYDNYGIPAATNTGRFAYTGQIWFKELGLYYYKARIYHPKLGRFLQTDPVGYEDQMNLYAYVGNDPVNMVDPSGNFGVHIHGLISYKAARASGFSIRQSLKVAYRAMQFDFEAGSQDATKSAVAGHAMIVRGQSLAEASRNHSNLIASATQSGDFGKASHAIQDSFAEGHSNFAVWSGGFWDEGITTGLKHLWHDIFPSSEATDEAYNATKENLSSASGRQQITPSSNSDSSSNSDNGMSRGKVKICTGMGVQKEGC